MKAEHSSLAVGIITASMHGDATTGAILIDEAARDAPVDVMKVMAVIAGHALVRLRQSGTVDVERLLQRFASARVETSPVSHQPVDESIGEHQLARPPGP